ncbi:uncharacterized protein VTP21DRAFT_6161 [Calcarisporiella thermophila]|uniref:uncharacterized protein n=1 Tax=Calcarisporiella thermophila TaxID=911321 RepID=UPI0037443AF1
MKNIIFICVILASVATLVASAKDKNGRIHEQTFGPDLSNFLNFTTDPLKIQQGRARTFLKKQTPQKVATQFAREHLTGSEFLVKDVYHTDLNGVTHVYLRQIIEGLEVVNGDININVDKNNKIVSYGNTFFREKNQPPTGDGDNTKTKIRRRALATPTIDPKQALLSFAKHLKLEIPDPKSIKIEKSDSLRGEGRILLSNVPFSTSDNKVPVLKALIHTNQGRELKTVWELDVKMKLNWFQAHIDAQSGEVIAISDRVSDAAYQVFPFGTNDPSIGPRKLLTDPHDKISSPNGWHFKEGAEYSGTTMGNNVYAQENLKGDSDLQGWEGKFRPSGGKNNVYDFPLDLAKEPKAYLNASITNLFYWNNVIHDLFYRYGFNEVSGNFQEDNFEKGGKGGDAVIAFAQDGSDSDNAYFWSTADGKKPTMQMFLGTATNPQRDGDLDSGIIVHEYSHGISNRLTGGPSNVNCLTWGEAKGMGEGWGDFFATILRVKPNQDRKTEFVMGEYLFKKGIRKYPYSTSKTTNPETYGIMDKSGYKGPHAKGAVWANILYEVFWNFVEKHGFTEKWFPPLSTNEKEVREHILKFGNTLILQLVVDGMKLQPCLPTFINARDAIIQADKLLTNGANECEIWRGFAKRGLGVNAKLIEQNTDGSGKRQENFEVPKKCEGIST